VCVEKKKAFRTETRTLVFRLDGDLDSRDHRDEDGSNTRDFGERIRLLPASSSSSSSFRRRRRRHGGGLLLLLLLRAKAQRVFFMGK
jgi:hypothetical protein